MAGDLLAQVESVPAVADRVIRQELADVIFVGEAEQTWPQFLREWSQGLHQYRYEQANKTDMTKVPTPRFDMLKMGRYAFGSIQFSRGCPFQCEFCDIIVIYGRRPRVKEPQQLLAELEDMRRVGFHSAFIVDDNFIGDKQKAKALLKELIGWMEQHHFPMQLMTEASIDLADDPELLNLMYRANFRSVFIGIETPRRAGLQESKKLQNLRGDSLPAKLARIQNAGLDINGGFIVGFDSDKNDIFERQFEFIQRSGVVTAMVGLLTALPRTRLYQRLKREGRIESESNGNNTDTALNFTPTLDRQFLLAGYRELMRRLYEPNAYYRRVRTFLESYRPGGPRLPLAACDLLAFVRSLWLLGVRQRGRRAYWRLLWSTLLLRPRQFSHAIEMAILGHHFRRVARSL